MERIGYLALLSGVLLIGLSNYYPNMLSQESQWSTEDDTEYEKVRLRFHGLAFAQAEAQGTPNEAEVRAKYEQSKEDYERLQANMLDSIDGANVTAGYLYWTGIVVLCVGIFVLLGSRQD